MAKEGKELTPMMKQFFDLKAKHPDDSSFLAGSVASEQRNIV